jgi:predicted N-acetyltransferase YhbS
MTYDALYAALKRINWLRSIVQTWRAVVERLRVEVWIIEGKGRHGGSPLKVLVAGQLEAKNYVAELLFKSPRSETHRRMWRSRLLRRIGARRSKYMMVFVDTQTQRPRRSEQANVFWSRGWVRTELDLALAMERIRRSDSVKSDLRKVRENNLSCDATTDSQEMDRFYWNMYVPYAQQGFGSKAVYMTHEQFRAGLKNGELLRVHKDGQIVAGMIILYRDTREPQWWVLGMRDGDRGLSRQGVLAALYLYGVQHLKEKGYSRALLGGVRPFLADGVLQYKRKWGARLLAGDDGDPHWLMVAVTEPTDAVRSFLKACPVICEDERGLVGRVFFDGANSEESVRMRRQTAELSGLGVDRIHTTEFLHDRGEGGHAPSDGEQEAVNLDNHTERRFGRSRTA